MWFEANLAATPALWVPWSDEKTTSSCVDAGEGELGELGDGGGGECGLVDIPVLGVTCHNDHQGCDLMNSAAFTDKPIKPRNVETAIAVIKDNHNSLHSALET